MCTASTNIKIGDGSEILDIIMAEQILRTLYEKRKKLEKLAIFVPDMASFPYWQA
jgi:hypothetical protein